SGHVGGAPPGGTGYVRAPFYDGLDGRATLGVPLTLGSVALHQFGPAPVGAIRFDQEVTYSLGFTLDDGTAGGVSVAGRLSGALDGLTGSTLRLTFPDEPAEVRVGDYLFRVRVGSVDIPAWGDPAGEIIGIPTEVTVSPADLAQVPEPGTLVLAALGVAACGLARRRRHAAAR
ncbi:MAG: PEP-CTERM sorting domain-containing protein, partial [Gemmataceae bacterium]